MELLFQNNIQNIPKVSIVLLDWSVRESFHTLEYLNRQRIDRDKYEIIWIEFYDRRAKEIEDMINRYSKLGLPLPVDRWIVMDIPRSEYYHKHKMYNLGILNSSGNIIAIMDSDAIVKTNFISTIIEEFEKNKNIALHLEEIRSFDRRFYPFNYPAINEVLEGVTMPYKLEVINRTEVNLGKSPISLKDDWNIMHMYNYGACFCARKDDLIRIGGADEHIDYMGHICGPYEMTFRLINAGIQDKLHPAYFLYHVYHPNQGGDNNYCGPNNGKGMSTTAMAIPESGRILPLDENEEIKRLRLRMT